MIHGIDISSWQGNVDFHAIKDNADFVIIRATYGNGYKDAYFEKNRDGARAVGLSIGFYHYCYPQYNTPEAEADWFTKIVSCQPGEILVLDFEEAYPNPVNWCKKFLDKCTSNMGFKPLIYLNLSTANSFDWSPIIKANYGLWLAHYDNNPLQVDKTPWSLVAMKQYSSKGNVAGISPVDVDSFYGDVPAFKHYGNPPPPAPVTPTPVVPITTPTNDQPVPPTVTPPQNGTSTVGVITPPSVNPTGNSTQPIDNNSNVPITEPPVPNMTPNVPVTEPVVAPQSVMPITIKKSFFVNLFNFLFGWTRR